MDLRMHGPKTKIVLVRMWKKGTLLHCWWGYIMGIVMKSSMGSSKC